VSKKHSQVKVCAGQPSTILDFVIFQKNSYMTGSIRVFCVLPSVLETLINFLKECTKVAKVLELSYSYLGYSKLRQRKKYIEKWI
jgi:hypothetical protein